MHEIVLATGNAGKLREFRAALTEMELEIRPQSEWQAPEAEETGLTFVENALIKARNATQHTGLPALADDSGLVVDALGGAPEFPDMLHEVARARELDEFAATHDAQLSFTLRARLTAWSPGFVHQQAARLGFTAGAIPGRMVLPAEEPGLPPVLGLVFDPRAALSEDPEQSAINSLALSLDVPQVHRNARPFGRLRDVAFALADQKEGMAALVDKRPPHFRHE